MGAGPQCGQVLAILGVLIDVLACVVTHVITHVITRIISHVAINLVAAVAIRSATRDGTGARRCCSGEAPRRHWSRRWREVRYDQVNSHDSQSAEKTVRFFCECVLQIERGAIRDPVASCMFAPWTAPADQRAIRCPESHLDDLRAVRVPL